MSSRAVYPAGITFKKAISLLKGLVDQIPLAFEPESLVIEALSPDKVVMVLFDMPASNFEEYVVTSPVSVVVNRDEFVKAVRRASRRDKILFEYSEGSRELKVKVFNIKSNIEKEVAVPLSEIGFERIGGIDIAYEVQASIPSAEFVEIIKDVALVGDEISFIYSSELNAIKVSAYGELAEYSTTLKQFQPLTYLESTTRSAIAKYSVDHLKAIAKTLDLAEECSIAFGPDKPLKISLTMTGGGRISIWIAPRG